MENSAMENIRITDHNANKPFLFVSYRSYNRDKMEEIISALQQRSGLRIYYDKAFETENDTWIDLMKQNTDTSNCRGMLVIGSPYYICSYACLMELIHFRTEQALSDYGAIKPIIPVSIVDRTPIGSMSLQSIPKGEEALERKPMQSREKRTLLEDINSFTPDAEGAMERSHLAISDDNPKGFEEAHIVDFRAVLQDIEKAISIHNGALPPSTIARFVKNLFKIRGENANFYHEEKAAFDHFIDQLIGTIKHACGEDVFEQDSAAEPVEHSKPVEPGTKVQVFVPRIIGETEVQNPQSTNDHKKTPETVLRGSPSVYVAKPEFAAPVQPAPEAKPESAAPAPQPAPAAQTPSTPTKKWELFDKPTNKEKETKRKKGRGDDRAVIEKCRSNTKFQSYKGCITPETTVKEFRSLMEQEGFCWWLRAVRNEVSMTEGIAVNCFHYVMAVILGGCSKRQDLLYRENYNSFVAAQEPERDAEYCGTWPSAVAGFLGSGRTPDKVKMKACEEMPESTTMRELQENFQNAAGLLYQTKSNDKINRLFEVFFTDSWVNVLGA